VSLLAPWLPSPWLTGSKKQRQQIVQQLSLAYAHTRPLPLFPYSEEHRKILELAAAEDRQKNRLCDIFLVTLYADEPFATTARRLTQARKKLGHTPQRASKRHHRYTRGSATALHRLTCYRLSNLPANERDPIIENLDFLRVKNVDSRVTQGRKTVLKDLRNRNYISLL
jgi:hypothetical protein